MDVSESPDVDIRSGSLDGELFSEALKWSALRLLQEQMSGTQLTGIIRPEEGASRVAPPGLSAEIGGSPT
eukprot:11662890-Alexandrium_andersonii.AAC.1